jgi:hypothetical protein
MAMVNGLKEPDLSRVAYLVPDLPRYEISDRSKFWEWWDSVTIPINRIAVDSRGSSGGYNGEFWDGVTIWQSPDYQKTIVWKVNYQPNNELFGEMVSRIRSELPWFDIKGITLWSNKEAVPMHRDGLPRDPFPSAPRIVLLDECENRTFYLIHNKPFGMFRPDLRDGPNLFYFNNENFYHGTSSPIGGRKVLARIDGPLIDRDGFLSYVMSSIGSGSKFEGL